MEKNGTLVVFFVAMALSFWAGYQIDKPIPVTPNQSSAALSDLKEKMAQLVDTDFQDYQRLKSMKAKYESANMILAKIMKIFLADLGLRISQSQIDAITTHGFLATLSTPRQHGPDWQLLSL